MNYFYRLFLLWGFFLTLSSYAASPVLVSPADRSTVNILAPVVIKVQANDVAAKKIYLKVLLNDPRKLAYETNQAVVSGQPNSFSVPGSTLKAGQQYLIEVKTVTTSGQLISQKYYTIFTVAQPLPVQTKPLLLSPTDTLELYEISRGFGLTVNPNNPNARKIVVNFELGSVQGPSSGFALTAQQANQPLAVGFNFNATGLPRNQVMLKKLVLTCSDSLGTVLAENIYSVPVIIRTPVGPQFISPAPGATGVSLTPTIVTGNYSTKECLQWVFSSYEIDTYPADWAGVDHIYAQVASNANQWTVPQTLKPNTKYEVRVYGGWICYGGVYYTSTFTTGSSSSRLAGATIGDDLDRTSTISPNPFAEELSIQLNPSFQNATIKVLAMDGRVVFTKQASGEESVSFKDNSLAPGLYLVHITDQTGKKEQFKVVKQ
ncbi:T9SS type A sorting domain-containing protein [Cytophagaceae bacterium DM2B3-1]|uniref:T9SS type A sorting domain-containing protein n=1 Tax=Xanthocytophaga flava TaxID=3048013 RepID=A0ABT7CRE5_9BACT|nr:T9SS type A sorting domain-containing protein [Xanthocytophaga flavus]MDJ1496322.1 T9SS type A sorting domain-containing protein [Xanthocytophaga flavus]